MKDHESAFPVMDSYAFEGGGSRLDCVSMGMSLKQYAAIHLKVPRSGDPDIDAMIRESRRAEFAKAALQLLSTFDGGNFEAYRRSVAHGAFGIADAMLAEWEKEEAK
jgi:hypothetical protein